MSFKKGSILFASVMLLLIMVLSFTGALNISSFRSSYTQSLVSSYAVAGNDTVRNLEYAIKYGKPLDNFFGMEKILADVNENSENLHDVQVLLRDGKIVYNLQGKVENQQLPEALINQLDFSADEKKNHIALPHQDKYHVFLPLHDRDREWIGTLDMVFDASIINSRVAIPKAETLQYLLIIALLAGFALLILYSKIDFMDEKGEINKKLFTAVILVVFSIAQLSYAFINFNMYKELYLDIARENTSLTAKIIQKDIDGVIARGLSYGELYQVEEWMQKVIDSVPEIDNVNIADNEGQILYSTAKTEAPGNSSTEQSYQYNLPLLKDGQGQKAGMGMSINISLSQQYVKSKTTDIALDALTVLIIAFFLMGEIIIFLLLILKKEVKRERRKGGAAGDETEIEFIRPLAFVFFLATSMSVSYIPLMMKELYHPIAGLSKEVVLGLPISVELLCVSISIIITGYIIDKKGWRFPFFAGLLFLAAGLLFSGLAWNGLVFILARGITGIGYGFSWMAMRNYCTMAPSIEGKTIGLSSYNSGIFAGFNCGIAIGAMLADRIGFTNVFFVALGAVFVSAYFVLRYMEKGEQDVVREKEEQEASGGSLLQFLSNPGILFFFVLLTIPLAVCSMFMDYFFPLYGASINLSTSNIGRGFLIYGLCIVYLGPFLSKYAGKNLSTKTGSVISALMVGASLVIFAQWGTLTAALVAILLLGLADSFGVVAQNNYFLTLEAAGKIGESKALAYYSTTRRMGQVAGPFVFGGLAVLGVTKSVGIIGAVTLGLVVLFFVLARSKKDIAPKIDQAA